MELPAEILAIVRDFSRPVTQPGWRKLHKMTAYHFHYAILNQYNTKRPRVIYNFVRKYSRCPQDIYKHYLRYADKIILMKN